MTAVALRPATSTRWPVAIKTLRERRRALLWWTVGLVALAATTVGFYPSIRSDTESFQELFENLPEGLLTVFGVDDTASLVTPAGFLTSRLYSGIGPVILAVLGISLGTAAVAGEEDRGTLNLLLAQPLTRTRLIVEKAVAITLATIVVVAGLVVTLLIANPLVDLDLSVTNIIAANVGLGLVGLFFAALSLAIGAITGSRTLTIGISAAVTATAFFVNGLAPLVDAISWTQRLSPFHWLQGPNPLAEGFDAGYTALLVGTIAVLTAASIVGLNRRDVDV